MVSKTKKSKKTKRRVYKRRNRNYIPRLMDNKPFPLIKTAKLRYVDELTLNSSGTVAYQMYGANCLYDPFISTGGHQPMAFDQLMGIYNHYEVVGSKITVQFHPTGGEYYCGVTLAPDTSLPYTSLTTVLEERGSTGRYVGVNAAKPVTVVKGYSEKKTWGKELNHDNQRGNAGANPTEITYFAVWQAGVGGADPIPCTLLVTLEYTAVFTELRQLSAS